MSLLTNKKREICKKLTPLSISEPMTRFELVTSSLPRKRSTPELHRLLILQALNLRCFGSQNY